MEMKAPLPPSLDHGDPRVYLASERTLLAWVRTGLAMMGFGFVVARFGLFLHELAAVRNAPSPHSTGFSLWIGTTLVLLGVVVQWLAAYLHWRNVARLQRGETLQFRPISLGMVIALVLGLLGAMMAIYLVFTGQASH
jgi:putative membrane protein